MIVGLGMPGMPMGPRVSSGQFMMMMRTISPKARVPNTRKVWRRRRVARPRKAPTRAVNSPARGMVSQNDQPRLVARMAKNVRADPVEGAVAQGIHAGEADDQVEAGGEHHVDGDHGGDAQEVPLLAALGKPSSTSASTMPAATLCFLKK